MMLHYQTKFNCKPTSSLEDIVKIVIFWLNKLSCDLDIEDSEPIFSHDIASSDNTLPYTMKKHQPEKTLTDILNLPCDLDLERSNHIFQQDTPACDAVLPNQVRCKLTSTLDDTTEIVIH